MRLSTAMVLCYLSYRVGVHNSPRFWRYFQEGLGTKVKLSTTFYPQRDGQQEHTRKTLEDKLRSCIIDLRVNWDKHFPLLEFAYNSSFHSTTSMAP